MLWLFVKSGRGKQTVHYKICHNSSIWSAVLFFPPTMLMTTTLNAGQVPLRKLDLTMHESIDFRILIGLNKHINMPGLQYRRDGNDTKFRSNLSTVVNGKPVSTFSKYKLMVMMRTKRKKH